MAFCSYFKIQPVAGGADRIKKSEWKLVSHDNSQPLRRAGTAAAFYRFRRLPASSLPPPVSTPGAFVGRASISPPLPRPSVSPSSFLSSAVRFSLFPFSRVRHTAYPSNFFLPFPHTTPPRSSLQRSSLPICLPLGPRRYRHTTIAPYTHTSTTHFVDRFKYGRCMRAKPFPVPILAYRDLSLISIYKSYYIREYRHSYDRTRTPRIGLFPLLARQGLIASTACFHGDC